MKKQGIWMSYDLGVDGPYEELYFWIDLHNGRECGDNISFLDYEYKVNIVVELRKELQKAVKLRSRDRIYIIFKDDRDKKIKGSFIFGGRKPAPWEGYGRRPAEEIKDEKEDKE